MELEADLTEHFRTIRQVIQEIKEVIGKLETEKILHEESISMIQRFLSAYVFGEHFERLERLFDRGLSDVEPKKGAVLLIDRMRRLQGLSLFYFKAWQHYIGCIRAQVRDAYEEAVAYGENLVHTILELMKAEERFVRVIGPIQ